MSAQRAMHSQRHSAVAKVVAAPRKMGLPQAVRIIGGIWKRSRIDLPLISHGDLRPTPDRVRETLFNWLGQNLMGWNCLDMYAGTGVLGFEAASRGAKKVWICERDPQNLKALSDNRERLDGASHQIEILAGDAIASVSKIEAKCLNLVFIDPPYRESALYASSLQAVLPLLDHSAWVYVEAGQALPESYFAEFGLNLKRSMQAGQVHAHLLAKNTPPI